MAFEVFALLECIIIYSVTAVAVSAATATDYNICGNSFPWP